MIRSSHGAPTRCSGMGWPAGWRSICWLGSRTAEIRAALPTSRSLDRLVVAGAVFGLSWRSASACTPPMDHALGEMGDGRNRSVHLRRSLGDDEPTSCGDHSSGLTSAAVESDGDREWLGRVAGLMLVVAVGWLALMGLVFLGSRMRSRGVSEAAGFAGPDRRRFWLGDRAARKIQPDPHHRGQEEAPDGFADQHGCGIDDFSSCLRDRRCHRHVRLDRSALVRPVVYRVL